MRTPREWYDLLIEFLREAAWAQGYAIGVHGSVARDIDLIAVPWTEAASSSRELAMALVHVVQRFTGWEPPYATDELLTARKPHGRVCWVIHLGGGPYIDLSIMPRRP